MTALHRPKKILVVDDIESNRNLMAALVENEGHEAVTAASGDQALEILDESFDLVLLDVVMPGMDGFETVRSIRGRLALLDIPVIIVTAGTDRDRRLEAVRAGANDFVGKPIDPTELSVRMASLLKLKEYHDELDRHRHQLEHMVQERVKDLRQALTDLEASREQIAKAHIETIQRLAAAAEYKDEDTATHLMRMSRYCALIAGVLGLDDEQVEIISHASPMHDIGKIGIPDAVLFKPGKLNAQEWEVMQGHCRIGRNILKGGNSAFLRTGAVIAYTHHERFDGKGYPEGTRGEAIPLVGRISAVADVFDALTSKRPYKEAFSVEKALGIMRQGRGSHFDPAVLDAFLGNTEKVLAIMDEFRTEEPQAPGFACSGRLC